MDKEHKLPKCQVVLNNLEEVIEDIKEGTVKGTWGRKIIDLGYHHPKVPSSFHLDDYFVISFSSIAYFLMHYQTSDKKETVIAQEMVQQLGKNAGNLLGTLLNQQGRFREYAPKTQELTAKMHEVWASKFEPMCIFLRQFVNIEYGQELNAYLIDMKTPITEETVKSGLQRYGLL